MTAYAAAATTGATLATVTSLSLFVKPVSYEIRIPQIVISYNLFVGTGASDLWFNVNVGYYASGSSGGTSITPAPLREESPAATATATSGGTGSGTFYQTGQYSSGVFEGAGSTTFPSIASTNTFSTPFDFILAPGSALYANITASGVSSGGSASVSGFLDIVAYFEELRLSWHY